MNCLQFLRATNHFKCPRVLQIRHPSFQLVLQKTCQKEKKKELDSELLNLFCIDFQPFSVVEDLGFRKFVSRLKPSYQLPSRKTITNNLIPAEYEKLLTFTRSLLSSAESVCITADTWTSRNSDSYIAATANFIKDFKMTSILLSCEILPGSYTSEHVATTLKEITDDFGLKNKIVACITDNTSNMVNAVKEWLGWKHFPCFAHTLNLIVNDGFMSQAELFIKIKELVIHFKRNAKSAEILNKMQIDAGIENPKKLINSIETRWNSTFDMLRRFIELEEFIKMAIAHLDSKQLCTLSAEEWVLCKKLGQITELFEEITQHMSGENYVPGSEVIVIVCSLDSVLDELLIQFSDPVMARVITDLKKSLATRFKNIELSRTLCTATVLDPRYKLLPFSCFDLPSAEIKEYIIDCLENIIIENKKDYNFGPDGIKMLEPVLPQTDRLSAFARWDMRLALFRYNNQQTAEKLAIAEFDRYIESPCLNIKEDPLNWWKENHVTYPNLSQLMKTKFNLLATSVPCERIYSKSGSVRSERRARLSPDHTEQLIFLNNNSVLLD